MIYRIILDGECRYEEVIFNVYSLDNTAKARRLIEEKYKGRQLMFDDPIRFDTDIFSLVEVISNKMKEMINLIDEIPGNDLFPDNEWIIKIGKQIFDISSILSESYIDLKSERIGDSNDKYIPELESDTHVSRSSNRQIDESLDWIYSSSKNIIVLIDKGYVIKAINVSYMATEWMMIELSRILSAIGDEGKEIFYQNPIGWTKDDSNPDNYSITEWR